MAAGLVALGEPSGPARATAAASKAATPPVLADGEPPAAARGATAAVTGGMDGATAPPPHGQPLWAKLVAGIVLVAAVLTLVVVFFPWDVLRGPLNRYVSDKTGRHFEITRRLDVKLGRTTRIIADGIEFANPDWAHDPQLVKAEGAEIEIALLPLLRRRIEPPLIELHQPQLAGRSSPMAGAGGDGPRHGRPRNLPVIGALAVDRGSMIHGHGNMALTSAPKSKRSRVPRTPPRPGPAAPPRCRSTSAREARGRRSRSPRRAARATSCTSARRCNNRSRWKWTRRRATPP